MITARASATRCACPCESSAGRARARSAIPSAPSTSAHARAILGDPGEVLGEQQILVDAEAGDEMQLLWHETDAAPAEAVERGAGERAEVLPVHRYASGARPQQPADDAEQRGLPAPGGAEHEPPLPGLGPPRVEREHLPVTVAVAEAFDRDHMESGSADCAATTAAGRGITLRLRAR